AVAHELVEGAFELEDGLHHQLKIFVENFDQHFWFKALTHGREATNVRIEHGAIVHGLTAALNDHLARQNLLCDVWRKQAAEPLSCDDLLLDFSAQDADFDKHRGLRRNRAHHLEVARLKLCECLAIEPQHPQEFVVME